MENLENKIPTSSEETEDIKVFSPKLGEYIPINFWDSAGDLQKYNIGLGPGSWY